MIKNWSHNISINLTHNTQAKKLPVCYEQVISSVRLNGGDMATDEEPANHKAQTTGQDQDSLTVLREIRDLLRVKLPEPLPKKSSWWSWKWLVWIAVLLGALFFLDFPSESRSRADLLVLNGTEFSIVKLPEPDWNVVGVRPSPEYWRVPNLKPNVSVNSLWDFSLYHQGRRYKHSAIRMVRRNDEPLIDLLSPPVRINGPTTIILNPISEFKDDDWLMATRIVRTHAVKADDQIVPLAQLIDPTNHSGRLVVETKPRIGWERFESNLSRAFGLLE